MGIDYSKMETEKREGNPHATSKQIKSLASTERSCKKCGFVTFDLRVLYSHTYKCRGKLLATLKCCYCKKKFHHLSLFRMHKRTCAKFRLKRKVTAKRAVKKQSKKTPKTVPKPVSGIKIFCPVCTQQFPSKLEYSKHVKQASCSLKLQPTKVHSARKSFSKSSDVLREIKRQMYEKIDQQSKTKKEKSLISENNAKDRRRAPLILCLYCKIFFANQDSLNRHLEKNKICAVEHPRRALHEREFTARKSMSSSKPKTTSPIAARKSFSSPAYPKNTSTPYNDRAEPAARKSFGNARNRQGVPRVSCLNQCPVCYAEFPDSFSFFQHQKKMNHWGRAAKSLSQNCRCPFCGKQFHQMRARNVHVRNHADRDEDEIEAYFKTITCGKCSQTFISEQVKYQHMKIEHPKSDFENNARDPRSHQKQSLLPLIIDQKLKEYPNTCPICSKDFASSNLRNRHLQRKHLDSELQCKFCHSKFNSVDDVENHMQDTHYDLFKFKCLACKINLATEPHVVLHVTKIHPGQNPKNIIRSRVDDEELLTVEPSKASAEHSKRKSPFFCHVCKIEFTKLCGLTSHKQSKSHREALERHVNIRHKGVFTPSTPVVKNAEPPEILMCTECSAEFTTVKDFVPHRMGHFSAQNRYLKISQDNPYVCEICNDVSDSHSKVQLHLFWHLQVDSTSFKKNSTNTKAKNEPIVPDRLSGQHVAKKSFSKPNPETQQEIVIGGIRKPLFTCEDCKIGFTTQAHYNVHVRRLCRMKDASLKKPSVEGSPKEPVEEPPKTTIEEEQPKQSSTEESPQQSTVEKSVDSSEISLPNAEKDDSLPISDEGSGMDVESPVHHCIKCSCLFQPALADIHQSVCDLINVADTGANKDISQFFLSMKQKNAAAICMACNSLLENSHLYLRHMLASHKTNQQAQEDADGANSIVHCTNCNCLFLTSDSIESHVSFCRDICWALLDAEPNTELLKPFQLESIMAICLNCSVTFSDVATLNEHMSTHAEKMSIEITEAMTLNDATASHLMDAIAPPSDTILNDNFIVFSDDTDDLKMNDVSNLASTSDDKALDPLSKLRENFTELFANLFASNSDVLNQVGYGEQIVDDVLINLLQILGQTPVLKTGEISDIDCFRKNIDIFLDYFLKDCSREAVDNGITSTDEIVVEALKYLKNNAAVLATE